MSQSLRIALLFGGRSHEAAVSKVSANGVAEALKIAGHAVTLIEADKGLAQALLTMQPDVVFPALHGSPGEDGTVQGLLEMLEFPYVGSAVEASAVAMNKQLSKLVFRRAALPLADDVLLPAGINVAEAARIVRTRLPGAVVVKPTRQGSALGVTPVHNDNQLPMALETALAFGDQVLIEAFITGREITVGVLDLHGEAARALPVIEIRTPASTWYDYHHRYTKGESEHLIPAPIAQAATQQLAEIAVIAHQALGCRDLSRADFVLGAGDQPILLEVNTLPGMTPTSLYPDAASAIGLSFAALTDRLVHSAYARRK